MVVDRTTSGDGDGLPASSLLESVSDVAFCCWTVSGATVIVEDVVFVCPDARCASTPMASFDGTSGPEEEVAASSPLEEVVFLMPNGAELSTGCANSPNPAASAEVVWMLHVSNGPFKSSASMSFPRWNQVSGDGISTSATAAGGSGTGFTSTSAATGPGSKVSWMISSSTRPTSPSCLYSSIMVVPCTRIRLMGQKNSCP